MRFRGLVPPDARKHQVPNGALRQERDSELDRLVTVRKHRAPLGALRLFVVRRGVTVVGASESTERHKVH